MVMWISKFSAISCVKKQQQSYSEEEKKKFHRLSMNSLPLKFKSCVCLSLSWVLRKWVFKIFFWFQANFSVKRIRKSKSRKNLRKFEILFLEEVNLGFLWLIQNVWNSSICKFKKFRKTRAIRSISEYRSMFIIEWLEKDILHIFTRAKPTYKSWSNILFHWRCS